MVPAVRACGRAVVDARMGVRARGCVHFCSLSMMLAWGCVYIGVRAFVVSLRHSHGVRALVRYGLSMGVRAL